MNITCNNTASGHSKSIFKKYEVIYYKRSNKVHKTKGVSRLDGILTIHPPPLNLVTLCPVVAVASVAIDDDSCSAQRQESSDVDDDDDDNNDVSDDSENDDNDWDSHDHDDEKGLKNSNSRRITMRKNNKKKKTSRQNQKRRDKNNRKIHHGTATNLKQTPVYSGKNADVVKRFMTMSQEGVSTDDDDIVILSGWDCQIIREIKSGDEENMQQGNTASISDSGSSSGDVWKNQSLHGCSRPRSKTNPIGGLSLSRQQSSNANKNTKIGTKRLQISKSLVSGFRPPLLTKKQKKCDTLLQSTVAVANIDVDVDAAEDSSNQQTQHTPLPSKLQAHPQPRDMSLGLRRDPPLQPKRIGSTNQGILQSTTRNVKYNVNTTSTTIQSQHKVKPSLITNKSAVISDSSCFVGAIGAISAPSSIKSILRPHQQSGIVFLWNCLTGACPKLQKLLQEEKKKRRGGGGGGGDDDDHVYGAEYSCMENGVGHDVRGGAILADEMGLGKTLMTITVIFALHRRNRNERFIVVCPSSLVENWAKEFDKFVGKASQPKRVVVRKGGEEGLKTITSFVPSKPQYSEVLIISYDLFRMNSDTLCKSTNIGLLVVDEGHRLKNTSGTKVLSSLNSLKCNARLLITGTPIQNNLSEFYNVANFVLPGILGSLSNFRKEYEKPISAANKKNATLFEKKEGKAVSKDLNEITSVFMIRRLQKDILKSLLPPRFETLLFCRPSQKQQELYKYLTKGPILDSLSTLTNLRKLCSHPDLLQEETHISNIAQGSCSESGKLNVLEGLLDAIRNNCPSDKVIVISNFTSALTVISDYILQRRGWKSVRLDGTTEQSARQTIVDSFNRSSAESCFVFLLSSKAGGCGLNLTGANRLIMYDLDWNPSTDLQAMARIYRQGQRKECFIYRLLTTGTIEEVMFQRQTQKNNLDTIATNKTSKTKSHRFTDEELRDCFTLKEKCTCDTKDKIGKDWEHYGGVQSLLEKSVQDELLLALARDKADVISYVHLVQDSISIPIDSDPESEVFDESFEEVDDWECFDEDSEEEAEFE